MDYDDKELVEIYKEALGGVEILTKFTFDDLWSEFRKVEQMNLRKYRKEVDAIGNQLNTMALIINAISTKIDLDPEVKTILNQHIAKTITSFEAGIFLYLRSLSSEACNSVRVGLETAWQMFYLYDIPEERHKWFNDEKITTDKPRKHLPYSDERWTIYKHYCELSHPRITSMKLFVSEIEGHVKIGPSHNDFYVGHGLYYINLFIGWICEDVLSRIFSEIKIENNELVNVPDFLPSFVLDKKNSLQFFSALRIRLNQQLGVTQGR